MSPMRQVQSSLVAMLFGDGPCFLADHFGLERESSLGDMYGELREITLSLSASLHYRVESQFGEYPLELLRVAPRAALGECVKGAMRELMGTPTCCLDESFSGRLLDWARAKADGGLGEEAILEALCCEVVIAAIRAWAEDGKASVAHVERLHAIMKHLICRSTSRPGAESVILLNHARRMMAKFTEQGHLDFSLEKNQVVLARRGGLVTRQDARRLRKPRKRRQPRQRETFLNTKSRLAKLARAGAPWTNDQEKRAREEWGRQMDEMTQEQVDTYLAAHAALPAAQEPVDETAGGAAAELRGGALDLLDILTGSVEPPEFEIAVGDRARQVWPLDVGDETWPLAEARFEQHLRAVSGASSGGAPARVPGVTQCAKKIRPELRETLLVEGPADENATPVPMGPVAVRDQCFRLHPGLCQTRDKEVYAQALAAASGLRAFVKGMSSGQLIRIIGGDVEQAASSDARPVEMWLCIGAMRQRGPPLAVFARCSRHACLQGVIQVDVAEPPEARGRGSLEFNFSTCYRVARDCVVLDGMQGAKVQEIRCANTSVLAMMLQGEFVVREAPFRGMDQSLVVLAPLGSCKRAKAKVTHIDSGGSGTDEGGKTDGLQEDDPMEVPPPPQPPQPLDAAGQPGGRRGQKRRAAAAEPPGLDGAMPRIHQGWGARKKGGDQEQYSRYDVPGCGYLYYAHGRKKMAAHCVNAACPHGLCRTGRSCAGSAQKFSGRPVGFLLAWLFAGHGYDQAGHQALARREQRDNADISYAERNSCRQWAKDNIPDVFAHEREREDGESEGPQHVCY
ncbi:unnamed protein product [Prorocentrum cordatum]|uniref:Uncharacterized protein n=1 Tax=Prorocentrum cordatum TaxID=2364126 RepID=A0ABN9T107_9DINO|nr:unnamed protein product [Polarella glacialis]